MPALQLDHQLHGPGPRVRPRPTSIILAPTDQLGIAKSFGANGAGPGGTTILHITGAVNVPIVLNYPVTLTDLLPTGITWANPASSGTFTLSQGNGAFTTSATATLTTISDYEGTQRELIRATIPASAFDDTQNPNPIAPSAGSWTITAPTNFFEVTTPTVLGTYPNTDQIFLYGLADNPSAQIDPTCTTPTQTGGGTSPATLESDNPYDLAGDGNLQEDYCQNGATLVVAPSGAAFNLTKTVQGDLDPTAYGGRSASATPRRTAPGPTG